MLAAVHNMLLLPAIVTVVSFTHSVLSVVKEPMAVEMDPPAER